MLGKATVINTSDVEGEVDHSFFDSDVDDRGKEMERSQRVEKTSQPAHDTLHARQQKTETKQSAWSRRNDGKNKHVEKSRSKADKKERNRVSSESSDADMPDNAIDTVGDDDVESEVPSEQPDKALMAFLTEAREVDSMDEYSPSLNESEKEPTSRSAFKERNRQSPKRRVRHRHTRTPSATSTEATVNTDSDCSSSSRRSSLDSPALSSGVRRMRVSSAGSRYRDVPSEDSDDTVTDVSPLSSPDLSPPQLLKLKHSETAGAYLHEQQEKKVPAGGPNSIRKDEVSDRDVECSLKSESQLGGQLFLRSIGGRNRKNYSFSNDEVRAIDRENQRLLRELSRLTPGPRPGSTPGRKTCASITPHFRLSHSALNRQREQQRIERENLAFLKRLESVKPTPGLKRSEQLADYQRQAGYLGGPSYPDILSTTKKGQSASRSPSGPRSASFSHHSPRPGSNSTGSSSTAWPGLKKRKTPRPAWC
ncbi:uncharacterized protein V6R79_006012 [Siganus canaliculatus]